MKPFYPLKRIHITLILVCVSAFLIQCSSSKKISKEETLNKMSELQTKSSKSDNNLLIIFCNQDTGYFDKNKKILHDKGTLLYCLREKGFFGDTASIKQIATLISLMPEPTGTFSKRLRGDLIFKIFLEKSKNFEFINDSDGNLSEFTVFSKYARAFSEMIDSINGMSQDDYINKNIYSKGKSELEAEELFSPKYIQILARLSWETYKEAYDKGLIKLKAFGQE